MIKDASLTMSYFARNISLNAEQLDYLARNLKVTQVSGGGGSGGCLMLLNGSYASAVLEDNRVGIYLIWADPDTVEALKKLGHQFEEIEARKKEIEALDKKFEAGKKEFDARKKAAGK